MSQDTIELPVIKYCLLNTIWWAWRTKTKPQTKIKTKTMTKTKICVGMI